MSAKIYDEAPTAGKSSQARTGKKKFYPKSKPIKADAPNRQGPLPQPARSMDPITEDALKPRHLSTTFTKPINDPADVEDFKVLGFEGFATRKPKAKVQLDYSGFLDLIEETYNQLKATDKYIERTISHSMFSYYCIVLLYQRMYTVRADQGHDFDDLKSDIDRALAFDPVIPKPIAHYLNQVGVFTDNNRRSWILQFHELDDTVYDTVSGGYGRVTAETHFKYASQPSPLVAAMRIIHDYVFSANSAAQLVGFERLWSLHPDLSPINAHTTTPNENLLGWARATKVRPEVVHLLESFGIEASWVLPQGQVPAHLEVGSFGRNVGNIPINGELLSFISTRIQQMPSVTGFNISPVGSQTIIPFTILSGDQEGLQRSSNGTCTTVSSTQLVSTRATASAVVRLRVKRNDVNSNYCYMFEDPYDRPNAWAATLNANFNFGQAMWLNYDIFGLSEFRGVEASRAFVVNTIKR